jgi:hypothetical protein
VGATVRETVNAGKQRFGPGDLAVVFEEANKVLVAKGKKLLVFDMKSTAASDPEFRKAVIGPSGYLRAPTLRTGKTMLVGFHAEAFSDRFS